jgi:hypothetical protein
LTTRVRAGVSAAGGVKKDEKINENEKIPREDVEKTRAGICSVVEQSLKTIF